MKNLFFYLERVKALFIDLAPEPMHRVLVLVAIIMAFVYGCSKSSDHEARLLITNYPQANFKDAQILQSDSNNFYQEKDKYYDQAVRKIEKDNQNLKKELTEIKKLLGETKEKPPIVKNDDKGLLPENEPLFSENELPGKTPKFYPPKGNFPVYRHSFEQPSSRTKKSYKRPNRSRRNFQKPKKNLGPQVVSFPVKKEEKKEPIVTLPAASFVKGRILTGVDAPSGKAYPALVVLDYAFAAPNNYRVDLSGCAMITKAQGDLSTERVQMQLDKLSCVSPFTGKMFERKVNGYVADQHDNSFALRGKVISKRKGAMTAAFLSSIVEGLSKSIQQKQTTSTVNPLGGSQSVVTGDQTKYMVAGGLASGASQITQWYLNHAKSLLPTIRVGAGRDIWLVVTDTVELPNEYFKRIQKIGGKKRAKQTIYGHRIY